MNLIYYNYYVSIIKIILGKTPNNILTTIHVIHIKRNNIQIKTNEGSINELDRKRSFHKHPERQFLVKTATHVQATILCMKREKKTNQTV